MRLCIYHGRIATDQGGTDLDGKELDDWGFEGPELLNVESLGFTYGTYNVNFRTEEDVVKAQAQTGWKRGVHEHDIEMETVEDLIRTFHPERMRHEFFGDFFLTEDPK